MTEKVILIGKPVSHSLSPVLHNTWLEEMDILSLFEVRETDLEEIPGLVEDLKKGRLRGINATMPYKEILYSYAGEADEAARELGAANTLYIRGSTLWAKNTDPEGFRENLNFEVPGWAAGGKTALVLGTGAAARAAVYSLIGMGASEIRVCGRDLAKAEKLRRLFPEAVINPVPWSEWERVAPGLSLFVNATPLGLPGFSEVDFDLGKLSRECLVYDLVYGREKTSLLKKAETQGLKTIDGLGMLVFQAIPAFEAWYGQRPSFSPGLLDVLRKKI